MDRSVKETVEYLMRPIMVNTSTIQQVYEEFHMLGHFLNSFKPNNILEIGSKGATFYLFNKFSTGKKVALDIDPHYEKNYLYTEKEDFYFICADSHSRETYNKVASISPSYDFIFIDGDHSYDGVKADFELYRDLLSPDGYIGFHDIDPNHILKDDPQCQVHRFWQDLDYGNKTEIICKRTNIHNIYLGGVNTGFGGIGIWRP